MSNPYRTERRTLGVRADYQGRSSRPAWTFAEGSQDRGQRQQTRGEARPGPQRQQSAKKAQRVWGQPFEVRCLLIAGEPFHSETPRTLRCQHVRANDAVARVGRRQMAALGDAAGGRNARRGRRDSHDEQRPGRRPTRAAGCAPVVGEVNRR